MKKLKIAEPVSGRYVPLPHALLDASSFMLASHQAQALLLQLMRQHDGKNNGHLHLARGWLHRRGWTSDRQITKAREELEQRGLIVLTLGERGAGRRNTAPQRYALTWLAITNFSGLKLRVNEYSAGAWRNCAVPTVGIVKPKSRNKFDLPTVGNARSHSGHGAMPTVGTANGAPVPTLGMKKATFGSFSLPTVGSNETLPIPQANPVHSRKPEKKRPPDRNRSPQKQAALKSTKSGRARPKKSTQRTPERHPR